MDRVRRMYASFDNRSPQPQSVPRQQPEPPAEKHDSVKPPPKKEEPPHNRKTAEKPGSMLDIFMKDQDQSLILLLLVMLMRDGADMNLMLALVYLLI